MTIAVQYDIPWIPKRFTKKDRFVGRFTGGVTRWERQPVSDAPRPQ